MNGLYNAVMTHILRKIWHMPGLCFWALTMCLCYPEMFPEFDYIAPIYAEWEDQMMTSVGETGIPVFMVEFQDVTFGDSCVSQSELEEWFYTGDDSIASYYNVSSGGRLKIEGDIYYYTAEGTIGSYETGEALEGLIQEILAFFDDEVDFSQYDKNGDGFLDALILSVPSGGDAGFWWAAQHFWYLNPEYEIDGVGLLYYLVNDEQPSPETRHFFWERWSMNWGIAWGFPIITNTSIPARITKGCMALPARKGWMIPRVISVSFPSCNWAG